MLLWKTSLSQLDRSETVRRPRSRVRLVPRKIRNVSTVSNRARTASADAEIDRTSRDAEERNTFKLVLVMVLIILLSVILVLFCIF